MAKGGKGTPPSIFWDTLRCYASFTTGHDPHGKKIKKYRLLVLRTFFWLTGRKFGKYGLFR